MLTILCCLWCLLMVYSAKLVSAQEEASCYGSGSIALSVILTIIFTILLLILLYYLWNKYRNRKEHLILETDPERGGRNEYAFDNPGFKDAGLTPANKSLEKANNKSDPPKTKWNQWSPLAALTVKSEKRKTLDDSAIDGNEVKVVALKSHDFTGLGFNICGNMKEGIYIKDVLHRGPASESGKLNPGDRINSVTISFEHMVYEDALTILSYASPYEVIIEAKSGKIIHHPTGQSGQPSHPVYRSSSCTELTHDEHSVKKKLFGDGSLSSNYSSLQKSRSNMTTLERKESRSPQINQNKFKKTAPKIQSSPEQFKAQLEQKISIDHHHLQQNNNEKPLKIDSETQKTENKFQKFGIRVLPIADQKSPKSNELSQNDNNLNLEKQPQSIDEVDDMKPEIKKRERKLEILESVKTEEIFQRETPLNSSGIRRDANGIPQEIPNFMMNAAVSARRNRRGSDDHSLDDDLDKTPRKIKGKAPAPPEEKSKENRTNFDEIQSVNDTLEGTEPAKSVEKNIDEQDGVEIRVKDVKDYNSDSDLEPDNQSSVNTIELNSSDITIHHAEGNDDQRQNRKTASTGDLTKIQRTRKSSNGTLERAQSLDITDTGMSTLTKKHKGGRIEDVFDMQSDEDLFGKAVISKEPRLSLILDGLNTFQRNRLKKSTEWGNLEDAILKLNQEDENIEKFKLSDQSEKFDALVNKINEIKRESMDVSAIMNVEHEPQIKKKKVKNQIWPFPDNNDDNDQKDEIDQAVIIVEKQVKSEDNYKMQQQQQQQQQSIPADRRQRKPSVLHDDIVEPEIEIEKIAKSDKSDHLLESRLISRQIYPPSVGDNNEDDDAGAKIDDDNESITKKTIKSINKSDESKTKSNYVPIVSYSTLVDLTKNFLFTERIACSEDDDDFRYQPKVEEDTNISDDIKVSRHSMGSLERPKSDDFKMNISNVTISSNTSSIDGDDKRISGIVESTDDSKSDNVSELYTTALDNTVRLPEAKVTITTPDIIKNVTITEAMNTLNNDVVVRGPSSLTLEIPRELVEVTETKYSKLTNEQDDDRDNDYSDDKWSNTTNSSLTYITEIQVLTPNSNNNNNNSTTSTTTNSKTNISEIEIIPTMTMDNNNDNNNHRNLDNEFENYVKNFESTVQKFENNQITKTVDPKSIIITEKIDVEKELHKIQEIAEEQLKKLPEMRFTTSSYESSKSPSNDKQQRSSQQIEILRSNFEKSPTKSTKIDTTKSRIPIATATIKTPPTSPERRDSRNLDTENAKEILELMSTANITAHSTPFVSKIKPPSINSSNNNTNGNNNNKNVTVTSIRNNSKLPSGLPVLSASGGRPPIPPRRYSDDNIVQVSTNGSVDSSFKQWVFNPTENSVTNIVVTETKQQK